MYRKMIMILLCYFVASACWADEYFYLENPDPTIYAIVWKGVDPSCHEIGPNGYETYGWVRHTNSWPGRDGVWPEYVAIVKKDAPRFGSLEYNYDFGANTSWTTLPGYTPYRTWACG